MRAARSPILLLRVCLVFAAISAPACKKDGGKQEAERARQSLEQFRAEVDKARKATADVRKQFNALPEDLPGIEPVRSKLQSVEEVMGVEGGRVEWLSGELNAAAASGDKQQVKKVSDTIASSLAVSKELGKPAMELIHDLIPFERMAGPYRALEARGLVFKATLPTGQRINAAKDGIENQLIVFLDDDTKKVDKKTWFAFDHLTFTDDGAQLDVPRSQFQLDNVAAILKAYPQVKLEVAGARAKELKQHIVNSGVDAARLTVAGRFPAQSKDRPVAVRVTAK